MGSNFTDQEWKEQQSKLRIGNAVQALKSHPNYKDKKPYKGESLTAFTLRCIAHLVSPPMEEKESNEIECTDLAAAILSMETEIVSKWVHSLKKGQINETEIEL